MKEVALSTQVGGAARGRAGAGGKASKKSIPESGRPQLFFSHFLPMPPTMSGLEGLLPSSPGSSSATSAAPARRPGADDAEAARGDAAPRAVSLVSREAGVCNRPHF